MRAEIWVLDGSTTEERVKNLLGDLALRELTASLRETPSGRVLVVENPPEDLERPAGVLRASSVEIPDASQVTRRTFLDRFAVGLAAATMGTGVVLSALYAVPPPPRRDSLDEMEIGSVAEIEGSGYKLFRFGRTPCVAIAHQGTIHALSTICSHLGCLVRWEPGTGTLACPCHRASFGLEGQVLEGPPPRPLESFLVKVVEDRVIVRRRTAS